MVPRPWALFAALIVLIGGGVILFSSVNPPRGETATVPGRRSNQSGQPSDPRGGGRASLEERTADFERIRLGPQSEHRFDHYKEAFRKVFAIDPTRALALLEAEPDEGVRRIVLLDVLKSAIADEIETVLNSADRLVRSDSLKEVYGQGLRAMAKQDPERALRVWNGLLPSPSRSEALVLMLSAWPVDQPVSRLFEFHQTLELKEDRGWFGVGLEGQLMQRRPEEVAALLDGPGLPDDLRPVVEAVWGRSLGESLSVDDLVHRTKGAADLPEGVWRAAFEPVIRRRYWELADSISAQPAQGVLESIGIPLVGQMAQSDPPRTAAWLENLPPASRPDAERMTHIMTTVWLQDDPLAASSFVAEWQNPRLKQLAALSIVSYLNGTGDTESAQAWAAQIRDQDLQPHLKAGTFP